jgi:hypothetical protein
MREDSFSVGIFAADFAVADTISGGIRDIHWHQLAE